ncbi:hypothetical protein [Galbibacter sp. PAP.153]|uniref:hypothetical protein n=1 Tax=Galbibacter sp. PAP.153 TaxID=3104623 RepID=UPI00300929F4
MSLPLSIFCFKFHVVPLSSVYNSSLWFIINPSLSEEKAIALPSRMEGFGFKSSHVDWADKKFVVGID